MYTLSPKATCMLSRLPQLPCLLPATCSVSAPCYPTATHTKTLCATLTCADVGFVDDMLLLPLGLWLSYRLIPKEVCRLPGDTLLGGAGWRGSGVCACVCGGGGDTHMCRHNT